MSIINNYFANDYNAIVLSNPYLHANNNKSSCSTKNINLSFINQYVGKYKPSNKAELQKKAGLI